MSLEAASVYQQADGRSVSPQWDVHPLEKKHSLTSALTKWLIAQM